MNLYQWESVAYADYGLGNIIVMARDVDEARNKVMEVVNGSSSYDQVARDIAMEPEVSDNHVIVISGSA